VKDSQSKKSPQSHPLETPFEVYDFKKNRISTTAIICCSHNGAFSLLTTLMAAKRQSNVFVYDDASNDETAEISKTLGLTTVIGKINIGKARGIRRMLDLNFSSIGGKRIPEVYKYIIVLDDDTTLSPKYVQNMEAKLENDSELVAVEGRLVSSWKPDQNFNGYIAARSFTSWAVHLLLTWTQSFLRARTWINGALTIYRSEILDRVVRRDPKFITEDNDWCWQIHRSKIGRIKFEYQQTAKLQEPQTFKELYKQHLRWNWGMFQVAREHKTGFRFSRPDLMWLATMLLTAHYILMPIYAALTFSFALNDFRVGMIWFIGRYFVLSVIGSIVSRQWRHALLWPYFILYDFNWRISVVHGLVKAIRQPVLEDVTWVSPSRHDDHLVQEVA